MTQQYVVFESKNYSIEVPVYWADNLTLAYSLRDALVAERGVDYNVAEVFDDNHWSTKILRWLAKFID